MSDMVMKPIVIYFPFENKLNKYNSINVEAISQAGFEVVNIEQDRFKPIFKRGYLVLNWVESMPANRKGVFSFIQFLKAVLLILVYGVFRKKIIWVKHNYNAHGAVGLGRVLSNLVSIILRFMAARKVVHSKNVAESLGYEYIPHPLYEKEFKGGALYNETLLCGIVGRQMRYKKIDETLSVWPRERPLMIVGQPELGYDQQLAAVARERKLNVDFDFRVLNDSDLAGVLSVIDVLVLPHPPGSAIVSGVYFLAKSYGCIVLAKEGGVDADYSYRDEISLASVLACIETDVVGKGKRDIYECAVTSNGFELVTQSWAEILV